RYGWLGAVRARMSVPIALIDDPADESVFLTFRPLIALENEPDTFAPVPFEYWRGRLALELGYRFDDADLGACSASFLLEHESDHPSYERPKPFPFTSFPGTSFEYEDNAAVRVRQTLASDEWIFTSALTVGVHIASCTLERPICEMVELGVSATEASADLAFQRDLS